MCAYKKGPVTKRYDKYWVGKVRIVRPDPISMIMEKIAPNENGCWIWTGKINHHGYGVIYFDGKFKMVHRALWEIFYGPLIRGVFCCHKCDVRSCVNPAHIFLGTQNDNMKDMAKKGRAARGEKSSASKLNEKQVIEILAQHKKINGKKLAEKYGVKKQQIYKIWQGRAWNHIYEKFHKEMKRD